MSQNNRIVEILNCWHDGRRDCLFLFEQSVQKKDVRAGCFAITVATTPSAYRQAIKKRPAGRFLSIDGASPIGRNALSAWAAIRLEGVIRNAIGTITVLAPPHVVIAVHNTRLVERAADNRTGREGCQRIPPAVAVAAITVAIIARAMMTVPVAGTVRRPMAAVWRTARPVGVMRRATRPVGIARRTFVTLGMTPRRTAIIANLFDVLVESRALKVHRRSHARNDRCNTKDQRQGPRACLFQYVHVQPSVWNNASKRLKTQMVPYSGEDRAEF
jgi:hypothetical protein